MLFAVNVSAQGKDFAGTWTLDTEKSGPPPAPGARGGVRPASDFTIKMDAKTFVVSTTRDGVETVMTYKLDGSDSKNTPAGTNPRQQVYNLTWDGDKVVIKSMGANGEQKTEFWLEGSTLVRQTTNPGQGDAAPRSTRTYFKRAK